jgi:magnesium and cobalt transporter
MDSEEKPPSLLRRLFHRLQKVPGISPESRSELLEILDKSHQHGILDQDALDTIQRVMQVSDLQVRDVMIPRSHMIIVDNDSGLDECLRVLVESAHSRFPVIDGERDHVLGILLAKDVLRFFDEEEREQFTLRDLLRPAVFIPESKRLNVLLADFRSNRNHMAVVVDEYGGVAGLVTIEDVLEQIVGEIDDEHDVDDQEGMIRPLSDGDCVVKALLPLDEFNEHFGSKMRDSRFDTIGGLVMHRMGHVPKKGESVVIEGLNLEIVHSDARRVHLLRISNTTSVSSE